MPQVINDAQELEVINSRLNNNLTIRLYSNNVTPGPGDSAATYTEVSGGGYSSFPLTFANWTITAGSPTSGSYNTTQQWTFTGSTGAPGNIYGYYVTRDSDGKLMWADRFPAANVPFVPQAGSIIRVIPKYTVSSQF